MAYGACAIDGRCPRMDGRAFGFSVAGKGLKFSQPQTRPRKHSEHNLLSQGPLLWLGAGTFDSVCTRSVGWAAWDALKPWVGDEEAASYKLPAFRVPSTEIPRQIWERYGN